MLLLSQYPRSRLPSISPLSPLSPPPPPPAPAPSRSLPTLADFKEDHGDFKEDQSRHPSVLQERFRESDHPTTPLSKSHMFHSPWISGLVVNSRIPPPLSTVSKTPSSLVLEQVPHEVDTREKGALASFPEIPVKTQVPHEVDTREEGARVSFTEIPVKPQVHTREEGALASPKGNPVRSQARCQIVTCEQVATNSSKKSQRAVCNNILSTSWLLVALLFLINLLPAQVSAQISTTEYVTFVAGTDIVNGGSSNTPPNVFPDARGGHTGFYDRTQKCFYAFGGRNNAGGNSKLLVHRILLLLYLPSSRHAPAPCTLLLTHLTSFIVLQ